jgi:catechol 2,3-dioxygenase-like lactoylglutathione lyase family enzyme
MIRIGRDPKKAATSGEIIMTVATTAAPATASHVKPTQLVSGTFVTTDLKRARRMCEELLGLECVEPEPGTLLIREQGHQPGGALAGRPYWVLEARQVPTIETPQEMLNHWGVFVTSQAAVDDAFEKINARQQDFGLGRVQKPRFRHGSYAFYFVDGDSNWWEIEYRTPDLLYTALREKGDQH